MRRLSLLLLAVVGLGLAWVARAQDQPPPAAGAPDLAAAIAEQRARLHETAQARDWLALHRAADRLRHLLLALRAPADDPLLAEADAAREKARRALRAKGAVALFALQVSPAENNDVAAGFTVLNVGLQPIAGLRVVVAATGADGKPSPGRIGAAHAYAVTFDPPLLPNESLATTVVLRFDGPSDVAAVALRVVGTTFGRSAKH
jgi:hypothetical protein